MFLVFVNLNVRNLFYYCWCGKLFYSALAKKLTLLLFTTRFTSATKGKHLDFNSFENDYYMCECRFDFNSHRLIWFPKSLLVKVNSAYIFNLPKKRHINMYIKYNNNTLRSLQKKSIKSGLVLVA